MSLRFLSLATPGAILPVATLMAVGWPAQRGINVSTRFETSGRWLSASVLGVFLVGGGLGCSSSGGGSAGKDAKTKAEPPAKVEHAPKEVELATVKLTEAADERLKIATVEVERRRVPRTTTYPGEVMIPVGRLTSVTAPLVGTVKTPSDAVHPNPTPGTAVKEGEPLFVLVPLLSPDSRATLAAQLKAAEGQVKTATEQLHIAKVNLDRAENLVRDRLGGSAALVDAKAQYDLAQTTLKAAEANRDTLSRVSAEAESGGASVLKITAPATGVIQNVHVQSGQQVAAGAPLFEVASLNPIWVKTPVYVGEMSRLAIDQPATIGGLSDPPGAPSERTGKPVVAPPSADPLAATVNVFYEVANPDNGLRPGERVGVTLPLRGDEESLVVPRAALLRDIYGGTWVYEKIADRTYARRRVLVDRVVGDDAVLVQGPGPGAKVVTNGSAEIYGTEFGNTK